jgi:hypothetical protein
MVIAKGSKDVPFNMSPNVPISSSETIASPTAAPPIPPASVEFLTLLIIFPNLLNSA